MLRDSFTSSIGGALKRPERRLKLHKHRRPSMFECLMHRFNMKSRPYPWLYMPSSPFMVLILLSTHSSGLQSSHLVRIGTIRQRSISFAVGSRRRLPISSSQLRLGTDDENMDGGSDSKKPAAFPINGIDGEENRTVIRRKRSTAFPSFAYDAGAWKKKVQEARNKKANSKRGPLDVVVAATSKAWETDLFISLDDRSKTSSRLLSDRSYARKEAFAADFRERPPSLPDISPPVPRQGDRFWIGTPFRIMVAVTAYLAFPFLTEVLARYVSDSPDDLSKITSTFIPGVSIVYGTFVSLTLSILYNRQSKMQEHASLESSLLSILARDLLRFFANDRDRAVEACQCVADQVGRLVTGSRGRELMGIMYSDPYARVVELVTEKSFDLSREKKDEFGAYSVSESHASKLPTPFVLFFQNALC